MWDLTGTPEGRLDEIKAAINTVSTGKAFDPKRTESLGMRPEQQEAAPPPVDHHPMVSSMYARRWTRSGSICQTGASRLSVPPMG